MAVDEDLNARMRAALSGESGITEKRMMGGMCFLLNGHMIGGADRSVLSRIIAFALVDLHCSWQDQ